MRKFFILALLFSGCAVTNSDEVSYTRNTQETTLSITMRNNRQSCTVKLKNAAEAKQYKERLQKIIKEIENFEHDLSIRENGAPSTKPD